MKATTTLFATGAAMAAGLVNGSAQDAPPLFKVGSVDVRPHATYSLVYDDNIFLEHKQLAIPGRGRAGRDHDWINTFTPGLKLNAGDSAQRQSAYFSANYEAIFQKFSVNSGADAIDQNALVEMGGKFNRLSLSLAQTFSRQSSPDNAVFAANGRVRRANYGTTLNSQYELSEKTTLGLDLANNIADYAAPLVDSTDRSANLYMDYQVLPKVKMGVSGGIGYLQVEGNAANHNPNSVVYNGRVRLDWKATEKVSIIGRVGLAFDVEANWRAAERTQLALKGSRGRRVSNAFGAQQNEETSIGLSLRQGLLDAVSLTVDGGYTLAHYEVATSAVAVAGAVRDDQYVFVKPALSYRFLERAQASIYYQYRRNDANLISNANDFYNNQIGLELSYRF
jgi:hypothetical protein